MKNPKARVVPKYRAGRYVHQPSGYRAFIPAPLPPDPAVDVSAELQVFLSKADQALGRLDGSIQQLPDPDLFVLMYVRKEAVLSSQIEGTQSSLQDVLSAEAKILGPERPKDVDEVVNYVRAMKYGLDRLSSLPLSLRLIREIHAELLRGARGSHLAPGEFRTSQNWIGPGGGLITEATFVPPPPHEVLPTMSAFESFLHEDSPIPLLIKVGLAHAQFETIHPFLDGNGRMGRLLITFLLCEEKALRQPVLYLSYYFKRNRAEYYDRLQAVRDNGAWEEWLAFFLRGIADVSAQATDTARGILSLREEHRKRITTEFGRAAGNGLRVLEKLYEHPVASVSSVREWLEGSYPAASSLVARMVDSGILSEITGRSRNRAYRYDAYIRLFDEI